MIVGLDSAQPPSTAQVAAARAAGVGLWSGYLATSGAGGSAFGLLRVWSQAEFDVARSAGSAPIAFCSGWDDPAGCRALAAAWGVRLCLDVESGIRGDGPWVQSWLDASGAGLYGNASVHWEASAPRRAAFHIVSAYFGYDPQATYYGPQPLGPLGWQWQGSHLEYGVDVDRGWYDNWFGTPMPKGGDMLLLADQANNLWYLMTGSAVVQVPDGATANALQAAGVQVANVPDAFVQTVLQAASANAGSRAILAALTAIQTTLANLPQAQIQPALDAIAKLQTDVTAIRTRTDKDLG